jgi:hypothetical protein
MWKQLKQTFCALVTLAMTLGLTASCSTSRGVAASRYLPQTVGVLRLKAGQTYQAPADEVWHSGARYQALELQLIDALTALKEAKNR